MPDRTESMDASTAALPSQPGARILRAEQARQWIDGYAFVQAAEAHAQRLRDDSEALLAQARAEAMAAAQADGERQVAALLANTAASVDAYLLSLQPALAELALAIAGQIVGALPADERLARSTHQALSAFRQDQALTLQVPRAELQGLGERLAADGLGHIAVAADDQLAAGQARLSSPVGQVELDLHSQLRLIRESLLGLADSDAWESQP